MANINHSSGYFDSGIVDIMFDILIILHSIVNIMIILFSLVQIHINPDSSLRQGDMWMLNLDTLNTIAWFRNLNHLKVLCFTSWWYQWSWVCLSFSIEHFFLLIWSLNLLLITLHPCCGRVRNLLNFRPNATGIAHFYTSIWPYPLFQ